MSGLAPPWMASGDEALGALVSQCRPRETDPGASVGAGARSLAWTTSRSALEARLHRRPHRRAMLVVRIASRPTSVAEKASECFKIAFAGPSDFSCSRLACSCSQTRLIVSPYDGRHSRTVTTSPFCVCLFRAMQSQACCLRFGLVDFGFKLCM